MIRASLLVLLLLSACAPSAQAIQTALVQTQAAMPTATVAASKTPTLTFTPRPTYTHVPTATNVPPKVRYPATMTAEAKAAKIATATELASYGTIPLKELITYPDNHVGEKISVRGRIFNVNGTTVQIFVNGYDAVYIDLAEPASGIYEDDTVTFWGTVHGSYCFENASGNQVCQPALEEAFYVNPHAQAISTPTPGCFVKVDYLASDMKDAYLVMTGGNALSACEVLVQQSDNSVAFSQVENVPNQPVVCEVVDEKDDYAFKILGDPNEAIIFCENMAK